MSQSLHSLGRRIERNVEILDQLTVSLSTIINELYQPEQTITAELPETAGKKSYAASGILSEIEQTANRFDMCLERFALLHDRLKVIISEEDLETLQKL